MSIEYCDETGDVGYEYNTGSIIQIGDPLTNVLLGSYTKKQTSAGSAHNILVNRSRHSGQSVNSNQIIKMNLLLC